VLSAGRLQAGSGFEIMVLGRTLAGVRAGRHDRGQP
jgi:hypothetical protein